MKIQLGQRPLDLERLPKIQPSKLSSPDQETGKSMGSALANALQSAENVAKTSDQAGEDLMAGNIEIHEAMVRMEKADLMLKLGATVRSKVVEAYQKLLTSAGG